MSERGDLQTGDRQSERDPFGIIRVVLLGIFLLGLAGLTLELVLLEHYDDAWQWTPFILFALALVVLGWFVIARTRLALKVFRAVMILYLAAGALGIFLHYDGNIEFEHEMSPEITGWPAFLEAIRGATPILAPGAMVQLGLIGLALTLRHPVLTASGRRSATDEAGH